MSGPVCQNCGSPYLVGIDEPSLGRMPAKCEFCGWKGDISDLHRMILTQESHRIWAEKMKKRLEGKLFIVHIEAREADNDDVIADIMDVFGLKSLDYNYTADVTIFNIEVEKKPSKDLLDKVRKIKGVIKVGLV